MAIILYSDHVEHSLSSIRLAISMHCPISILQKAKYQRGLNKLIRRDQVENDFILLDNENQNRKR